jgi:hypothetical protein
MAGLGNKSYVGIDFETAWGTRNASLDAGTAFIDINQETITVDERPLRSPALTGVAPLQNKVAPGPRGVGGDVVWTPNFDANTLLRILKLAMGSHQSTDEGTGWRHDFRPTSVLPAATVEAHFGLAGTTSALAYFGGQIASLRGTITPDNFMELTTSWLFKDTVQVQYVDETTITFDGSDRDTTIRGDHLTLSRWDPSGATAYDIACVREFEFTYDNKLNPDRRCLGSRLIKEPDRSEKLTTGGRAVVEFDDVTLLEDFLAQTRGEMIFKFETAETITGTGTNPFAFQLWWPRTEIRQGTPTVTTFGTVLLEVEWEGLQGTSGGAGFFDDAAMIASVTNSLEATYLPADL